MRKIQILYSGLETSSEIFSELLTKKFNLRVINIGNPIRKEIKSKSEIGKTIKSFLDSGELVPNELINELLKKEIGHDDSDILFDGFPRTENQFFILDLLKSMNFKIVKVWYLKLDDLTPYVEYQKTKSIEKYGVYNENFLENIKIREECIAERINLWDGYHSVTTVNVDYNKKESNYDIFTRIINEV